MSVADYIKKLTELTHSEEQSPPTDAANVLRDLDEAERALEEIGANLEPPFFDIPLTARVETRQAESHR